MSEDTVRTPMQVTAASVGNVAFPLVVSSAAEDGDPVRWADQHREWIAVRLYEHGAILFRNTGIDAVRLRDFAIAVGGSVMNVLEESSPRTPVARDVMTSTDYPNAYPIQFHNEFSYGPRWPMKLFFCCLQPSSEGGNTPLADCRRVLDHLSAATRARFCKSGILYRRNYFAYMGVNWRTAFNTSDRAVVDRYCYRNGIRVCWESDNGLRTEYVGNAITMHPRTGELVWFNHGLLFNIHSLEPPELRSTMMLQPEYSTNTFYGDGAPIEAETIEEIRQAYEASSVEIPWLAGDVLLLDNMLVAHARRAYRGKRRIVVCMADPFERSWLGSSADITEPSTQSSA